MISQQLYIGPYALHWAIDGREDQFGFTITLRRSRCVVPVVLTDFDFANDVALVSDSVTRAPALLLRVEGECQKVGLRMNAKKTEVMTFNIEGDVRISTIDDSALEVKDDFNYLGSYIRSTEKDIQVRKVQAWRPRTFESRPCQILSKGPCFGHELNPFCYMTRRLGHSQWSRRCSMMAATYACSGRSST